MYSCKRGRRICAVAWPAPDEWRLRDRQNDGTEGVCQTRDIVQEGKRDMDMERKELLPSGKKVYKANLHCHTVLSDGKKTPEEIKRDYQAHGYSVVAFTDHSKYANHAELNDSGFLALAGMEVQIDEKPENTGGTPHVRTYHFNIYDREPSVSKQWPLPKCEYGEKEKINAYLQACVQNGGLVCYNHPYWSMQTSGEYSRLEGCFAMEIYNHGCQAEGLYGYNPQAYSEMLRAGHRIFCVAADDNHNWLPDGDPLGDSYGGFVMLHADALCYPAVIKALENGEFYSSMGPEIHALYLEAGELYVQCSPVEKIYVITRGCFCHKKAAAPGETVTEAVFRLTGNEEYIWLDCVDAQGRHAVSNAYFL